MNIQEYLRLQKERVDTALEKYLKEDSKYSPTLFKAMEYSLKAGGKRVRPILALAAAQSVGGALSPVMPVACALEMIHTFSLVHDDLPAMDDDDLRRGIPTNHKVFGEGVAVLAGDGLLSEAVYLLTHRELLSHVEPRVVLEILRDIASATGPRGMVGGQVLDLEGEDKRLSPEELENIHRHKTGALITVSVTSGAKVAGGNEAQVECLRHYGVHIGLAFQIADDLLDVTSSTEQLGKTAGADTKNKKSTYPALLGVDGATKMAKENMDKALAALKDFGESADPLREIAKYVVERKN